MAIQEADGIVNSYLDGIKIAMQRKQQENEQQYRTAETERANKQTELLQKQYDEQIKQNDLAHKASMATFQLQAMMHGRELAQGLTNENQDPSTPGKYTIQGPDGNPVHFNAQTPQQQLNQENLLKKQDAEVLRETEKQKQERDQVNRLAEIGAQGQNAKTLETQRGQTEERITKIRTGAQMTIDKANNDRQTKLALFNAGMLDPSELTGGVPNTHPSQVFDLRDKVLSGELTDKDLMGLAPPLARAIRNQTISGGGIVPKEKDLTTLNTLQGLVNTLPKVKQAIDSQTDAPMGLGHVAGALSKLTNPDMAENFKELSGYSPKIAQVVGGEAGQRLTDFKIGMSSNAFLPNEYNLKKENIRRYNNLIDKLHSAAEEVLGNYPAGQRALILKSKGFDKIGKYDDGSGSGTQGKPTAAQFDRSSQ